MDEEKNLTTTEEHVEENKDDSLSALTTIAQDKQNEVRQEIIKSNKEKLTYYFFIYRLFK